MASGRPYSRGGEIHRWRGDVGIAPYTPSEVSN